MLMLIPMTLTFMQGHSGSEEEKVSVQLSQHPKQARSIKLDTTVGHVFKTLTLTENVYMV